MRNEDGSSRFQQFIRTYRTFRRSVPDSISRVIDKLFDQLNSGSIIRKLEAAKCLWFLVTSGHKAGDRLCYRLLELVANDDESIKRSAYQALSSSTPATHDGLFLATNLIQRDLRRSSPLTDIALTFLANSLSRQIHSHVTEDLISLLTHSRVTTRKKALLRCTCRIDWEQ